MECHLLNHAFQPVTEILFLSNLKRFDKQPRYKLFQKYSNKIMSTIPQLVERLEQLDRSATSPDTQLDNVLECLSLPIEWLNEAPTLVNQAAWKQHVWHVFKDMVPQWTFALGSSTHKRLIQDTLYLPLLSDSIQVAMARISLPILLECLATTNQQDVTLDTLEVYSSSLRSLLKLIPQYGHYIARNDVRFFCSLICSIPGHLVNAFGIQSIQYGRDLEWYADRYRCHGQHR